MTVAPAPPQAPTKLLTYADYMAEGEINRRYDIIDGERIFMPQPTDGHQELALNIAELLRAYQRKTKAGRAMIAPCDVLITRDPFRTRQPDVLFVSNERYRGRTPQDASPWSPAPELVAEILSPSERRGIRLSKIADYCAVDVKECWLVSPQAQTVEVLRLTPGGPERAALHGAGETLQSLTFEDLTLALDDIFHIED
ncbi:MAG: Uma2 family endonuclease [Armatimonadetes bacterium]|nr:Uma2 family endonuclease [Armatimonadota bacterium]